MPNQRQKKTLAILCGIKLENNSVEKLNEACTEVLNKRNKTILSCRHQVGPDALKCYRRGSLDGKKAPCIRRDQLKSMTVGAGKAHLRAYHLSFLSKATADEVQLLLDSPERYEIRHLCGHSHCDNPQHLKLGTVEQNEGDKSYHAILDKVPRPEELLQAFRAQLPGLDVL
jgi:hypothetical protein